MNHDHTRLILDFLDGTISEEDLARLNAVLLASAGARAQMRSLAAAEVRLRELGAGVAQASSSLPTNLPPQAVESQGVWLSGLAWLRGVRVPITAGLAAGAVFTSALWAMVASPAPEVTKHLVTLLSDGFETGPLPGHEGVPQALGSWGGDRAEPSAAVDGVVPRSGARMLRFLRSDYPGENSALSHVGDQLQVIDLAAYRTEIESGRVVAHAEAWFNQVVPAAGEEFAGGVTLFAFARDPRVTRGDTWNAWYEGHLGLGSQQQERTDRDPATWERVSTRLSLPPGTRFLVVHIRVNRTRPEPTAMPITFAGSYVDDVKAELLLRPAANVAAENAAQ